MKKLRQFEIDHICDEAYNLIKEEKTKQVQREFDKSDEKEQLLEIMPQLNQLQSKIEALNKDPFNIKRNVDFIEPPPAMPEKYRVYGNSIQSYHNYYIGDKRNMSRWTNREMPLWFADGINMLYDDALYMFNNIKLGRIISMPMSQYNANI